MHTASLEHQLYLCLVWFGRNLLQAWCRFLHVFLLMRQRGCTLGGRCLQVIVVPVLEFVWVVTSLDELFLGLACAPAVV